MMTSPSSKLYKVAAPVQVSKGTEELIRTKKLRNLINERSASSSILGSTLKFLKDREIPTAATGYDLYKAVHNKTLKADTYLGAVLRGDAQPGDLRYSLFTNERGMVPVEGTKDTFIKTPRASATKPLQYAADVAILPLTAVGLESLKDPEENQRYNPQEFGGIQYNE